MLLRRAGQPSTRPLNCGVRRQRICQSEIRDAVSTVVAISTMRSTTVGSAIVRMHIATGAAERQCWTVGTSAYLRTSGSRSMPRSRARSNHICFLAPAAAPSGAMPRLAVLIVERRLVPWLLPHTSRLMHRVRRKAGNGSRVGMASIASTSSGKVFATIGVAKLPSNKQLERTVIRRRVRAASAPFHYALAARWTARRAAAQLRRYALSIQRWR